MGEVVEFKRPEPLKEPEPATPPVLYDGAPWPDVPWPAGIDDLEWW